MSTDKNKTAEDKAVLIEHMLSEVEDDLYEKKRPNEFIESLREQFDKRRSLSDKQVDALKRFYENVGDRGVGEHW